MDLVCFAVFIVWLCVVSADSFHPVIEFSKYVDKYGTFPDIPTIGTFLQLKCHAPLVDINRIPICTNRTDGSDNLLLKVGDNIAHKWICGDGDKWYYADIEITADTLLGDYYCHYRHESSVTSIPLRFRSCATNEIECWAKQPCSNTDDYCIVTSSGILPCGAQMNRNSCIHDGYKYCPFGREGAPSAHCMRPISGTAREFLAKLHETETCPETIADTPHVLCQQRSLNEPCPYDDPVFIDSRQSRLTINCGRDFDSVNCALYHEMEPALFGRTPESIIAKNAQCRRGKRRQYIITIPSGFFVQAITIVQLECSLQHRTSPRVTVGIRHSLVLINSQVHIEERVNDNGTRSLVCAFSAPLLSEIVDTEYQWLLVGNLDNTKTEERNDHQTLQGAMAQVSLDNQTAVLTNGKVLENATCGKIFQCIGTMEYTTCTRYVKYKGSFMSDPFALPFTTTESTTITIQQSTTGLTTAPDENTTILINTTLISGCEKHGKLLSNLAAFVYFVILMRDNSLAFSEE